jgi:hypothetical protein
MEKRILMGQWTPKEQPHPWRQVAPLDYELDPIVTLGPLEIKTFVITV